MAEVVALDTKPSSEQLTQISEQWQKRISRELKKRQDNWFKDAEYAEAAYSMSDGQGRVSAFNILFSNVETIVPAIFNSMPVPDIRERFKQGDKVARNAADILENVVSYQTDDSALDVEVEDVARDAVVAGRGVLRIRFKATTDQMGNVTEERVTYEAVSWRDYLEGPASRFQQLPWAAFRHRLSKDEVERIKDQDIYERQQVEGEEEERKEREDIWEIWCRKKREVIFMRYADGKILSVRKDPLGLKGFFPVCKPVQPVTLTGKRDPVVPYKLYRQLADELDKTTRRINAIVGAIQVKGIAATGATEIAKLAQAGDNEIITSADMEGLMAVGGVDKAIMWWPIEMLIAALNQLYIARDQTKQTIYEVTGISDIVRGASDARETATAQGIKNQWGGLRIKRLQVMVERLVREAFVMTVELISSKFSPETIQAQSGIQLDEQSQMLLQDPLMNYRIDVESDSTVRGDLSRQKGEMAEFLKGTAEFFGVMQPVVANAPQVAGPVVSLYASFARQFNLGRQAETALDNLVDMAEQAAQQPRPNPEAQKMQVEMQMKGQELQLRAAEAQAKTGLDAQRLEMDKAKAEAEALSTAQKAEMDRARAEQELALKREQGMADLEIKRVELELKRAELALKEQQGAADMALRERDMDLKGRAADMDERGREMEGKEADLAMAMAQFAEAVQAMGERIEAGMQSMGKQIADGQSRPKTVVRDENGRVVGVQ